MSVECCILRSERSAGLFPQRASSSSSSEQSAWRASFCVKCPILSLILLHAFGCRSVCSLTILPKTVVSRQHTHVGPSDGTFVSSWLQPHRNVKQHSLGNAGTAPPSFLPLVELEFSNIAFPCSRSSCCRFSFSICFNLRACARCCSRCVAGAISTPASPSRRPR